MPFSILWSRPILELAVYAVLYAIVLSTHARRAVPVYNQKFRKSAGYHLPLHIITGLFEVARYQVRSALAGSDRVPPTPLDMAVCLVWSATSLLLVRSLQRGDPATTRPSYQAGTVLRPLACAAALALGSPALHRASVKAVNSFLYARLGIFVTSKSTLLRHTSSACVYAVCIPLAAVLSIHEGGVPGAVPLYVATVVAVARLNRWVSARLRVKLQGPHDMMTNSSGEDMFLMLMLALGFVELDVMRELQRRTSLSPDIRDDYIARRRSSSIASPLQIRPATSFPGDVHISWEPGSPKERPVDVGQSPVAPSPTAG